MNKALTGLDIILAAEVIKSGKLVAFPTETVYGLGANALNAQAVQKIFELKGRPGNNPLIVHIAKFEQIEALSPALENPVITSKLERLKKFWPGPLSVVLPKHAHISDIVSGGQPSIAVRIPNHPIALALLEKCGLPLAAPSANPSNYISPTTAQHVHDSFGTRVACILDGGPCEIGLESTVLSLLENQPKILRPGAISRTELEAVLEESIAELDTCQAAETLTAPGQLPVHYAPYTRLIFSTPADSYPASLGRLGLIAFKARPASILERFEHSQQLTESDSLEEIGSKLFAALRDFDTFGLDAIVIDTCQADGLGKAIMDRLMRAAARSQ